MKSLLILFAFTFSICGFCQPPVIQWQKCYGGTQEDQASKIIRTLDNRYAFIGYTESVDGDIIGHHNPPPGFFTNDAWLCIIDSVGSIAVSKCYGGMDDELAHSIIQLNDSDYVFISEAHSNDGDITFNNGTFDYWVAKTSNTGILKWNKCYGAGDRDIAFGVLATFDSCLLVSGSTKSNVPGIFGVEDIWLLKLNGDTTIRWAKCYGGYNIDFVESAMIETPGSNYVLFGATLSNDGQVSGNHGSITADSWLLKIDSGGQLLWQKCLGGTGIEESHAILSGPNGDLYLAGLTTSNNGDVTNPIGNGDIWIIKTDSSGNLIWQKCFGGSSLDEVRSTILTSDGGIVFTGVTSSFDHQVTGLHGLSDIWVVKIDTAGNFIWGKTIGGTQDETGNSIIETPDGGYLIAGVTDSNDGDVTGNHGSKDAWIVKLSPPGMNIASPSYSMMDLSIFQSGDQITTRFFSRINVNSNIEVYNLSGQRLFTKPVQVTEGINYFTLPAEFATGIYNLKINWDSYSLDKKFIVN